jgi:hypothetical protein
MWLWLLAQMGETRRILKHFGAGFLSRTFADHDQGPLGNAVAVLGDFDGTGGAAAAGAGFETGAWAMTSKDGQKEIANTATDTAHVQITSRKHELKCIVFIATSRP